MTSIDYPRPWYHVISLLCLNSAGEERRIRGSPCLQRPVPRQLQRSLCDLVLQPKWTHSFVQDYSVLPCQNVPNSHEPISFRNGNTLEGLSFFGFSCPLLSTRPLHRKVADKDYLNNGLGDLAGFAVFPPSYWCTALVAALLWAPFKTRRVEIWYRYDEMRWNDMWYMCTYEMSDSEWLRVTPRLWVPHERWQDLRQWQVVRGSKSTWELGWEAMLRHGLGTVRCGTWGPSDSCSELNYMLNC